MAQESQYPLIRGAQGYVTKSSADQTNENYLVGGSQNMIITAIGKPEENLFVVSSRGGYELFGAENSALEPIDSQFVWRTNRGDEIMLRKTDTDLQYYSEATDAWEDLLTTLSASYPCRFDTIWNTTELIDELLFVNHSSTLYSWTGATGTLPNGDADVTAGTITIAEVIAEEGFLTTGTRSIMIKDSGGTWRTTAYTGQSGSAFTVSTDLSAFTFAAGAPVVQVVRTNANTPASGFTNDTIKVLDNQVWVGSHTSRRVYVSKNTSYTDFAFSSPRLPGEGALLTLDDTTTALEIGRTSDTDEEMVIFSGRNRIYRSDFQITQGDSGDREIAQVRAILNAPKQGAVTQELVGKTKNTIIFLNAENELVELGSLENVGQLQYTPISDPIKTDFESATFTGGSVSFKKNFIYVSAPVDSKTFIFDLVNGFWNPPQILPVAMFSDYGGNLYGHSSTVKETYKLFTGLDDDGAPITYRAYFAYRNGNKRDVYKNFDRYYLELFMTSNAIITLQLLYEYLAAKNLKEYTFNGTDNAFIVQPNQVVALGISPLGINPLGGRLVEPENLLKYRRIKKTTAIDHFEFQARWQCESDDSQFYIIAHGPQLRESENYPVKITN